MRPFIVWMLCICFLTSSLSAQDVKKELTPEEVKAFVAMAKDESSRVTVKVKGQPVDVGRNGWGPKELRQFSGIVRKVDDETFLVIDCPVLIGSIDVVVRYDNVASVKRQSKPLYRLRKTGEIAAITPIYAALVPVVLVGVVLCPVTNGKVKFGCPR